MGSRTTSSICWRLEGLEWKGEDARSEEKVVDALDADDDDRWSDAIGRAPLGDSERNRASPV